jgi:REP element-mobilizing transposase RayT
MNVVRRKNIRLSRELYCQPGRIFSVTICTAQRRKLFDDPRLSEVVIKTLQTGPVKKGMTLYAYCLMPDHLHLLLGVRDGDLVRLIGSWKSYAANLLREHGVAGPCWQRSFYDHALRAEEEIRVTAEYIVMNPVRLGLVPRWEEYPYAWHRWVRREGRHRGLPYGKNTVWCSSS